MGVINNVKALISTSKLTNLANAIRNKTGEVKSYTIDEMIEKINGMGSSVLTSLNVTTNGTYTPESGVDGFNQVDVNVNPDLRPLSVSENGQYSPDGFDGYESVVVDVPAKTLISESVLAENKMSETVHENYWIENYLPAEQESDALYVIEFENNNAPNYGVEKLLVGGSRGSGLNGYTGCLVIRRDNGVDMRYVVNFQYLYQNNTRTCAASIGTTIKVYKLRYAF